MPQSSFIRHLRSKARHMAFNSLLYNWSLGGAAPDRLTVLPADTWPGDAAQGSWLLDAFPSLEREWPEALQGFEHMRNLRALGGNDARRLAREMIESWTRRHRNAALWSPALTGQRVANWIALYDFYGASADEMFQDRLFDSLVRQARHLARTLPGDIAGLALLHGIRGLAIAGLAFAGREVWLAQALDLLQVESAKQILPDGGHISRSPAQLLESLRLFMDIRPGLAAAGYPVPEEIEHTIDRMAQAVRFFRYPDKGFALFNGAQEGDESFIDTVLTRTNAHGRILRHLPQSGFERATMGRSLLMLDAAAPPPHPYDTQAHAAPLAFEFIYGKERVLVSCGTHPSDPAWQDALRGTAAHNTLTIDSRNACEITGSGAISRRPRTVMVSRNESKDAILLEGSHDGYVPLNGISHRRRLYLSREGHDLRGEDSLTCSTGLGKPVEVALRFHLHPRVQVSLIQGGAEVLLRLAGGAGWRFSHGGGKLALENSLYLGSGAQPRRTKQIVLNARMDSDFAQIKWALQRESF
jgi:uncharacterized heparinase superfamily protein